MIKMLMTDCMIVKVYAPPNRTERLYLTVVDMDSAGVVLDFSVEGLNYQDVLKDLKVMGVLVGEFELYAFEGVLKWKAQTVRFYPGSYADYQASLKNGASDGA